MKTQSRSIIWIPVLILAALGVWHISQAYLNYFEEPHLSQSNQEALNVKLLSEPTLLPDLSSLAGSQKNKWFGLLLQPDICDAICQGEVTAFKESGQAILQPSSPLYASVSNIINNQGYREYQGLLLLVNPDGELAGSIMPPYSESKIEEAFAALNK